MRSRFLRAAVVLATFMVAWLVVKPAQAAAPRCDPRGAITFAPPPQLQDPDASIDIGVDGCGAVTPLEERLVSPERGAPEDAPPSFDSSAAATPSTSPAMDPPAVRVLGPPHEATGGSAGVRSTIERPPRA
jgi:hypothetical protein